MVEMVRPLVELLAELVKVVQQKILQLKHKEPVVVAVADMIIMVIMVWAQEALVAAVLP